MKKYALILAVALLASPAFAAVHIIVEDADGAGPGLVANISYQTDSAAEKVAAFALNVDVTAGAIIEVNDFHVGVSVAGNTGYGIFPANFDRFITVNGNGDVDDWGVAGYTPVADVNDKGVLGGLGDPNIVIEMGALYKGDGNAPPTTTKTLLCTLTCSEGCTMKVTPNAIRGNVVLEGATEATLDLSMATAEIGGGECFPASDPGYAAWVTFGKPRCWCYKTQCHGDTDGLKEGGVVTGFKRVFIADLNLLIAAWNVPEPPKGPGIASITNGICADFGHDQEGGVVTGFKRVFISDLNILIANWNIPEPPKGAGVPKDCPGSIDPDTDPL